MNTSLSTEINFTKICRICLLEFEEMHSIFSVVKNEENEEEHFTYIYEILMNISSIKILTEDQMPTTLCSNCLELANTSYKFQQQCNRSQMILETYLTQINTNKLNGLDAKIKKELSNNGHLHFCDDTENSGEGNINETNFINIESSDKSTEVIVVDKTSDRVNNFLKKIERIQDEQVLDASKVAALEDNIRLKAKLTTKKVHNGNIEHNNFSKFSKNKLSYYLKTTDKGSKVYACNICDKSYKFSSGIKVHMRTHTLERPYVCTLCGKDFKQYGSLTYHLRSHSGEQPYKCKICGKKYKQSGSLKAHMRIHTGQRPFLCSVCGRGFRQAPDLGYHMRTHTKEKPYMCNICGKTMSMQCHLVQHIRTHTGERPYKCTECDKAFPSTTRLKRHAIIHTGLKPYTCDVCDRSFNRKSTLRVHAKIHTDDRPHVCSVCGKGFIQAHSLRTHVATHYTSIPTVDVSL